MSCRGVDSHEELQDVDPLPFTELVIRPVMLYKHIQEHPVTDSISEEDIVGIVNPEMVEPLCNYLFFADQAHDCGTEENLKTVLDEHGTGLSETARILCTNLSDFSGLDRPYIPPKCFVLKAIGIN